MCQNCVFFLQNCLDVKNEVFEKKIAILVLSFFCWKQRNRKKKNKHNGERPKNPIKIVFLRWSSKNDKMKKMNFQKLHDTICVRKGEKRAFSCTLSVLAKEYFGPKQLKPGKTMKIVISAEIAQNLKWHLFCQNGVFDMGVKVGLLTVFLKSCVLLEHYFHSVFSKTQQLQ